MTMKTKHPFFPIAGALLVLFLSAAFPAQGQNRQDIAKKDLLKQGNRMYKRAEYDRTDSLYAQAVALDTTYATGWYNLGNSLYLGGDVAQAQAAWMKSLFNTPQDDQRAPVLYNLGGVEMDKKNYAEAIKLYKDALRRDPSDEQARYNLALAQQLLKDQQQNQPQNNQNQDNNQNQNNDNNQNDQNQNNNNNNNDPNQNDQNQNNNNNNNDPNQNDQNQNNQGGGGSSGQQAPQRLSPSDEQMLRAIDRQEQNTQDKLKGDKTEGAVIHTTKDW